MSEAMTGYEKGRAAGLAEAVAECERIIANPKPGLWNYGTHPSRLDEALFNGRKEAAQDLAINIAALSPLSPSHVVVPRKKLEALHEALSAVHAMLSVDMAPLITWGDDYNQAIKDCADRVERALSAEKE